MERLGGELLHLFLLFSASGEIALAFAHVYKEKYIAIVQEGRKRRGGRSGDIKEGRRRGKFGEGLTEGGRKTMISHPPAPCALIVHTI